jgi:uncharacterized protein YcfJ
MTDGREVHVGRLALLVLALMAAAVPAAAQAVNRGLRGPGRSQLFAVRPSSPTRFTPDTTPRNIQPTHWKQGLLVGGAIGAAGFGALGYGLCHELSESQTSCLGTALGTAAVGAVIGGVTGALIGGAVRKQGPADSTTAGP